MCIQGTTKPAKTQLGFASVSSSLLAPHPASSQGLRSLVTSCQFHSALASLDPASPPDLRQHPSCCWIFLLTPPSLLSLPIPPQPLPQLGVAPGPLKADHNLPKCQTTADGLSQPPIIQCQVGTLKCNPWIMMKVYPETQHCCSHPTNNVSLCGYTI